MTASITGGAPAKPVINLSDADMADLQALKAAGLGSGHPRAPAPPELHDAILSLRRQRGQSKAQRFAEWRDSTLDVMNTDAGRAAWSKANADFMRTVRAAGPTPSQVHTNRTLSNLSVQYANDAYIGEELCPAVLVDKKSDTFKVYTKRDRLAFPSDDTIADNGQAREINDSRSDDSYACVNRGYQNNISASAVANQDAPLNEMFDLTEALVEARHLMRERRLATVLTTAGNYPSANKETLAGADQWNHSSGGNPIAKIQAAKAALWQGMSPAKTKAFSSLDIYNCLSRHPDITGLFLYSGTAIGLATPELIARFFGLDDYLVGAARYDSATEGDSASYSRIWGDFFGLVRVADRATIRSVAFCMNMRWKATGMPGANAGIVSTQWFDPTRDLGGSFFAKVGESEHAKVVASDAGFLYSDCLA